MKSKRFKSKAMFTFVGGVLIINPAFAQDKSAQDASAQSAPIESRAALEQNYESVAKLSLIHI